MIGQTISHYRIVERLGGGGMGVVYKAEDTKLHRHVALKFLPQGVAPDSTALRRFEREAQAASALNHPNICTIYEVEEHNRQPVIVMELLEGESLKERTRKGAISTDELLEFGMQSSSALEAAHAKGIIHRDIKPGNIFIVGGGWVKILDFGLAKVIPGCLPENEIDEESLTVEGAIPGTTAYMSPEQVRGEEIDARSDLFSLGVVLYEMATGKRPFAGKNRVLLMNAILNAKPAWPSRVNQALPASLDTIIARALEKDRAMRYQHAADLCSDLKRLKRDRESGQAAVATAAPAAQRKSVLAGWKLAVSAGIVAITIAAALFFYSHRPKALTEGTVYFVGSRRSGFDSVAVLPFANASGDPNSEFLADGITEGIIDRLAGLPDVKVISRTSAFHYKQREIRPQQVAKELGVQALVIGRIVQHGDDLSVSSELVDAHEDKQLWGEQYSRKLADSASLQQEIATAISGSLRQRLSSAEKTRLASVYTANTDSYQLYLKGRYHLNRGTAEGHKKGIEYFRNAIAKDAGNAQAYASMADAYDGLGGGLVYMPPNDTFPKAKAAATKALDLDSSLSEAHAALGYAEWFYDLDWPNAEAAFKRAIALNPNSVSSHLRYAQCLVTLARFDEAIREYEKAQELDPLSPLVAGTLGYAYLAAKQYDRSIAQHQKALELEPGAAWIHSLLALTYAAKGMYPEALAEYDKIAGRDKAVAPENLLVASDLGWIYAVSGRRNDALKIAQQLRALSSHAYVDYCLLAGIYAGLGDTEEAFRLLEKGREQRSASMPFLTTDPFWTNMRSDPRFTDLAHRVGLLQ